MAVLALVGGGLAAAAAAPAASAAPAAHHTGIPMVRVPGHPLRAQTTGGATIPSVSENWSGYAVHATNGHKFSGVQGSWSVPAITCTGNVRKVVYDSFWVGLDGLTNGTVEQDGTSAYCGGPNRSTPEYYAWYEMYPAGTVELFTVNAGDQISASVNYTGGQFVLNLADSTNGQSGGTTAACSECERTSAEWIMERPAYCNATLTKCALTSLANFGSTTMTGADASYDGGQMTPISGLGSNYSLDMVDPLKSGGFISLDSTGPLTGTGDSFSVQWVRSGTPTPIQL